MLPTRRRRGGNIFGTAAAHRAEEDGGRKEDGDGEEGRGGEESWALMSANDIGVTMQWEDAPLPFPVGRNLPPCRRTLGSNIN